LNAGRYLPVNLRFLTSKDPVRSNVVAAADDDDDDDRARPAYEVTRRPSAADEDDGLRAKAADDADDVLNRLNADIAALEENMVVRGCVWQKDWSFGRPVRSVDAPKQLMLWLRSKFGKDWLRIEEKILQSVMWRLCFSPISILELQYPLNLTEHTQFALTMRTGERQVQGST
jgi:hypothetical protein